MIVILKKANFSDCGLGKIALPVSDRCKEIASNYSAVKTPEQLAALQNLMDSLGYGVPNSIWSKLNLLILPMLSSNVKECTFDVTKQKDVRFSQFDENLYSVNNGSLVSASSSSDVNKTLLETGLDKVSVSDVNIFALCEDVSTANETVTILMLGTGVMKRTAVVGNYKTSPDGNLSAETFNAGKRFCGISCLKKEDNSIDIFVTDEDKTNSYNRFVDETIVSYKYFNLLSGRSGISVGSPRLRAIGMGIGMSKDEIEVVRDSLLSFEKDLAL